MSIYPNFIPGQPIPNNPFYSPETTYLQGPYHPWISAAGNTGFDFATGVFTLSGGGGSGTVTSIIAGAGLSGGTITTSGTIAIANTGVTASTYDNPLITVNSRGQLTTVVGQPKALTIAQLTGKGSLITATAPTVPTTLAVGVDGTVLTADSTAASGLRWVAPATPPIATPVSYGTVLGCSSIDGVGTVDKVALGCDALLAATGSCNTALGTFSQCSVGAGSRNTSAGRNSLRALTTGNLNVAVGFNALCTSTVGCYNTAIGSCAGSTLTTGSYNLTLGYNAQPILPAGNYQLSLGFSPTDNWLTGDNTKAIRPGAGIVDCTGSCGTAGQVLSSTGSNAVLWGSASAATPTVPGIVYGCTTLSTDADGCNVALGENALLSAAGGGATANTAIGHEALCGLATAGTGYNTAIGFGASRNMVSGCCVVAIGLNAAANADGQSESIFIGSCAGLSSGFACGTVGIGAFSAAFSNGGNYNTAVGHCSLLNVSSGCNNVAIGCGAGTVLSTGCNNVLLGANTGIGLWPPGLTGSTSNWVALGNGSTTCVIAKVAYSVPSDIRYKKVAGNVPLALPFVQSLNPITYQFCDPTTGEVTDDRYRYGFSAQEVLENEVDPEHPVLISSQDSETLVFTETMLLPILVNAIKELSDEVKSLRDELTALKQ